MKKILFFVVFIFTLQISYSLNTSYIRVIQSVQPFSAANISDSGNRMVFIGTYSKTQQGIFLSQAPLWQHVQPIVVTGVYQKDAHVKLKSFLTDMTENPFTDFDGPIVSDQYVAFAAMNSANKFGLFYAESSRPMWKMHKIVLVGDQFQKGVTFVSLNPPYTFEKHHVLFLAKLSTQQTGVFSYDIDSHHLYQITSTRYAEPKLTDFLDMSVNQSDFAVRALQGNVMDIYLYNGDENFKRISPAYSQTSADHSVVGRPSYFQVGEKPYVIFPVAMANVRGVYKKYGIFGNLANDNDKQLVATGDTVPGASDSFYMLNNPSLTYDQGHLYFTFEGTTKQLPDNVGAYLAMLDDKGAVKLTSLVNPAQIFDSGHVQQALLGAVSIRHNNIPVSVAFKSGYYGIYLFQVKD